MADYSQYIAVKKVRTAQTANANTSIVKGRAPNVYDGYFPLYRSVGLPINALLSNKFTSRLGGDLSAPPAPSPFSPLDISGALLWLDAADSGTLVLSSGKVAQWNDKSGNGYSVAQANASRQPLLATSPDGITLQGGVALSQTVGNIPLIRDATTLTMMTVVKPTSTTDNNNIITIWYSAVDSPTAATTGKFIVQLMSANTLNVVLNTTTGAVSRTSTNIISINSLGIAGAVLSGTASVDVNGTLTSGAGGTLRAASSDALFTVGFPNYNNNILHEVLIYNSELSTLQRQQVEGYLAWKWGLQSSLPVGHPYKLAKP